MYINLERRRLGKLRITLPRKETYNTTAQVSLWSGVKPKDDLWVKIDTGSQYVILSHEQLNVLMKKLNKLKKIPEKEWRL